MSNPSPSVAPPFTVSKTLLGSMNGTNGPLACPIMPEASTSKGKGTAAQPVDGAATSPCSRLESLPKPLLTLIAYHLVTDDSHPRHSPSCLIPLYLTSRKIYNQLSPNANPQLYNSLFRFTFDNAALLRRYQWMIKHLSKQAGRGKGTFDLFSDPKSWATDYQARWMTARRMKKCVQAESMRVPGICDWTTFRADGWNVWFMLTENGESTR